MLEIDYTVFIQVANFLVLLLLLNILLYKPIRGILAKRREQETALKNSTEDFQSQADQNEKSIVHSWGLRPYKKQYIIF